MPARRTHNVSPDPSWIWNGTVPSLHGLRAVSILIVILNHTFKQANLPDRWLPFSGPTGVDVFFVISGFLITLLLIRERESTGRISLRSFYIRRVLRIFPAYYFFLAVMCGLTMAGIVQIPLRDLGFASIYASNLLPASMFPVWDLAHCWSLCVEEHFYIVWPLILTLFGRKLAFLLAVAYIFATPYLRYELFDPQQSTIWAFTPTRADTLACGCCLAIAATSKKWRPRMALTPRQCNIVMILSIAVLYGNRRVWDLPIPWALLSLYSNYILATIDAIVITALVWASIVHSSGLVGRILNSRVAILIGTLSYSLYLWQQPFTSTARYPQSILFQMPFNIVCAFCVAAASYYLIELRFLKYKSVLTRKVMPK